MNSSKQLLGIRCTCIALFFCTGWVLGGLVNNPIPKHSEIFSDIHIKGVP